MQTARIKETLVLRKSHPFDKFLLHLLKVDIWCIIIAKKNKITGPKFFGKTNLGSCVKLIPTALF
jgi:hypothetical protein